MLITFSSKHVASTDSADDTSTMEKREELLTNKPPLAAKPESNPSSANTSSSSQSTFDPRTFDVSAAAAAAGSAPHCAAVDPALPRGPPAVDQVM